MGILQRSSTQPARSDTGAAQQRVWAVPKQGSREGRQEENPITLSSHCPEGVLPSRSSCVSVGVRQKSCPSGVHRSCAHGQCLETGTGPWESTGIRPCRKFSSIYSSSFPGSGCMHCHSPMALLERNWEQKGGGLPRRSSLTS